MTSPETDSRAALDRFLADNPELEQLSARLATVNILRALKIERAEIRHSNVLGWLESRMASAMLCYGAAFQTCCY